MAAVMLLLALALAIVVLPVLAGADTRDGRDWQPPSEWRGRRGA
jgi:hypothetical protein